MDHDVAAAKMIKDHEFTDADFRRMRHVKEEALKAMRGRSLRYERCVA